MKGALYEPRGAGGFKVGCGWKLTFAWREEISTNHITECKRRGCLRGNVMLNHVEPIVFWGLQAEITTQVLNKLCFMNLPT